MLNLFSIPAGMWAELGNYADRLADKLLASGELNQKDRDEFFNRMYESGVVTIEADEYFQNARKSVSMLLYDILNLQPTSFTKKDRCSDS